MELLKRELTISKVVKNQFRFCGLDLNQKDGKIELSMEDYAKSLFIAPIPNKTKTTAKLTPKQMTMLRGQIGALSWLSTNVIYIKDTLLRHIPFNTLIISETYASYFN